MGEDSTRGAITGPLIGGTIAASIVAVVVLTVVSGVVGLLASFFYSIFTVIRPGIIEFFALIIGSIAGVAAARASCDAIFKVYSPKTVFVVIAAICAAGLAFELLGLPFGWARVNPIAQLVAVSWFSFLAFWRDEFS